MDPVGCSRVAALRQLLLCNVREPSVKTIFEIQFIIFSYRPKALLCNVRIIINRRVEIYYVWRMALRVQISDMSKS